MKLTEYIPAGASHESDGDLFKQLFKQYASGIYRLAYAQLHVSVEAQDIVQECFLKFWEKRHTVSPDPAAIRGYLYTSAYHAILNQLQRQNQWSYQEYSAEMTLDHEPQLVALEYQELKQHYHSALERLPTKRRQIFTMSRQQGMPNASIAQELNISVKTVEGQLTQALKFLRTYFRTQGVVLLLLKLLIASIFNH